MKGKQPATVIIVEARERYYVRQSDHALDLWKQEMQVERTVMPTIAQMISDQIGRDYPMPTHREVEEAYQKEHIKAL